MNEEERRRKKAAVAKEIKNIRDDEKILKKWTKPVIIQCLQRKLPDSSMLAPLKTLSEEELQNVMLMPTATKVMRNGRKIHYFRLHITRIQNLTWADIRMIMANRGKQESLYCVLEKIDPGCFRDTGTIILAGILIGGNLYTGIDRKEPLECAREKNGPCFWQTFRSKEALLNRFPDRKTDTVLLDRILEHMKDSVIPPEKCLG